MVTESDLVQLERSLAMAPTVPPDRVLALIDEVRRLHRQQREELPGLSGRARTAPRHGAARKHLVAMLAALT